MRTRIYFKIFKFIKKKKKTKQKKQLKRHHTLVEKHSRPFHNTLLMSASMFVESNSVRGITDTCDSLVVLIYNKFAEIKK